MAAPLEHASQRVPKVTHVALPSIKDSSPGGAIPKANYVTSLALQPGDVDAVQTGRAQPNATDAAPAAGVSTTLASVLRQFEGTPLPNSLPEPSVFANVAVADLLAFGSALQSRRSELLTQFNGGDASAAEVASMTGLLNSVTAANKNFTAAGAVTPVGVLNLERLEMTPAGITRGDLLATIPLAPGETTSVYQKEWSVTSSEFTSIVTDSLENYSATGVTENTNLAQSTTSQNTHNNQYNVTASASGGCGFVSSSVATSIGASNAASQSATQSRNDAVATTRQASTRTKQSHKMSISTTTVTGNQESSTRTLSNPSANAIRIDYFSMLEEWRVRLYRYGMRLTYDLTIPEPGATLREAYGEINDLTSKANQQFSFRYGLNDITTANYFSLAKQFGVAVPAPPSPDVLKINLNCATSTTDSLNPNKFSVPDGYWINKVLFESATADQSDWSDLSYYVDYVGTVISPGTDPWYGKIDLCAGQQFLFHQSGDQFIQIFFNTPDNEPTSELSFTIECVPTDTAMAQWQSNVWTILYNAAQSQFYASQQAASTQLKSLQDELNSVDTLTLRREENDEIMKGILRFLLGAWFDFMPQSVIAALQTNLTIATGGLNYKVGDQVSVTGGGGTGTVLTVTGVRSGGSVTAFTILSEGTGYRTKSGAATTGGHGTGFTVDITVDSQDVITHGEAFAKALLRMPASALSTLGSYGQKILFINEAIEWENLIFYLDSYFWDIPASWDFIRQIQHPDADRQAFLRAGSARVVVPVRKGYETAWTQFVQTGSLSGTLPANSPYMTIAQEIQDYDNTNYPGISPANPADQSTASTQTTSSANVGPSASAIQIAVASSAGFIVGLPVSIDAGAIAESQTVTQLGSGSITVSALKNAHNGSAAPFSLIQSNTASTNATMAATICASTLSPSFTPVAFSVQSSAGFIAGYTALIDSGQNAESQLILSVGNGSITVQRLMVAHDGSTTPFPVAQQSEAGILIAEWNEYTPTSGTDIAVNSSLPSIS